MNGKEMVKVLIEEKIESLEKEQKQYVELSNRYYELMMENSNKGFELRNK